MSKFSLKCMSTSVIVSRFVTSFHATVVVKATVSWRACRKIRGSTSAASTPTRPRPSRACFPSASRAGTDTRVHSPAEARATRPKPPASRGRRRSRDASNTTTRRRPPTHPVPNTAAAPPTPRYVSPRSNRTEEFCSGPNQRATNRPPSSQSPSSATGPRSLPG